VSLQADQSLDGLLAQKSSKEDSAVCKALATGVIELSLLKPVDHKTLMREVVPFLDMKYLEKHPEYIRAAAKMSSGGSTEIDLRALTIRAIVGSCDKWGIRVDGLPNGFIPLYSTPLVSMSMSELKIMGISRASALLESAVYIDEHGSLLSVLSPVERAFLCTNPASFSSFEQSTNWFLEAADALRRAGIFDERMMDDYVDPPQEKVATDIREALHKVDPVTPEAVALHASKARAYAVSRGMSALPFVRPLEGTPGVESLFDPAQSPLSKVHSFMVGNVTGQVDDISQRLLLKDCEEWAAEQYPSAAHGDFKPEATGRRADYDASMRHLRHLLVVDSMFGDNMPAEARSRLQALRNDMEQSALTELAYSKSPAAGSMCRMMVGRSSKSWLSRYGDEVDAFMTVSRKPEKRDSDAKSDAKRKFSGQLDTESVIAKAADAAASKAFKKAKMIKFDGAASEAATAVQSAGTAAGCQLCGKQHKGGFEGCAFNPTSPNYASPFSQGLRDRLGPTASSQGGTGRGRGRGNSGGSFRGSSSASGGSYFGRGRGRGAASPRENEH
jgi:hypothetical protein